MTLEEAKALHKYNQEALLKDTLSYVEAILIMSILKGALGIIVTPPTEIIAELIVIHYEQRGFTARYNKVQKEVTIEGWGN